MHIAVGKSVSQGQPSPDAVSRLSSIHEQTGDSLAKSSGEVFEYLQMALKVQGANPKAAENCIEEAKKALAKSVVQLQGRSPTSSNFEAYSAIVDDQTKALSHFLNGNLQMASFLLETASMNAVGIHETLRISGEIKALNTRTFQPNLRWAGEFDGDNFGSQPTRFSEIFRNAYGRCTSFLKSLTDKNEV